MRISSFKPYSKNTHSVKNRPQAAPIFDLVFFEHRQVDIDHQTVGRKKIKWMSSQADTVNMPNLADVSTAYKPILRITKKG